MKNIPPLRNFLILFLINSATSQSLLAQSDVTGYWVCDYSGYAQDLTLTQSGETVSGTGGYVDSSAVVFLVTGTVVDNKFDFQDEYVGDRYRVGTSLDVSGNTMTGIWGDNNLQSGSATCTKSTNPDGTGGTPTPGATKRQTSLQLFCNRSGPTLGKAKCSVTVADKGAPTRKTLSGGVNFFASDGFVPSATACVLQQTPFSPGVSACEAEFNVPIGFTIGAKFPISAAYVGSAVHELSSTSHKLIVSSCVGDAQHPCSGAVAMEFADNKVLKNKILTIIGCGGKKSSIIAPPKKSVGFPVNSCAVNADFQVPIVDLLNDFGADEWREIAKSITKAEAKDDPLLLKIKEIGERNLAELQPTLANSLKHAKEIEKANQQYEKKYYDKGPKPITLSDLAGILKKAAKVKAVNISFGNAKVGLKPGTQKSVPIALNARGKQYVKIFKQANITFMPVRISLSYLKKGTDKLKTIKSEVQSVGLN